MRSRLFVLALLAALLCWCCAGPPRRCDEPCRLRGFAGGELMRGFRGCFCANAPQVAQ